jgi:hypothetical protein
MFVYRVKVGELTERSQSLLRLDLNQSEKTLREFCPMREMSVVADTRSADRALDIYLALDDFIESAQLHRLLGELKSMIGHDMLATGAPEPRISTELILI